MKSLWWCGLIALVALLDSLKIITQYFSVIYINIYNITLIGI